jgi:hypothetical protein
MFRALRKLVNEEKMAHNESFINEGDLKFVEEQRGIYQDQLPNMIAVGSDKVKDSLKGVENALRTTNPVTRRSSNEGVDVYTYATSTEIPEELRAKISACETASIDQLIQNQNPFQSHRCGWLYEKGVNGTAPKISRGVLGTVNGPLQFAAKPGTPGKYYWDLLDAQKTISRDRCNDLVTCTNVENSEFAGKCAFDPIRGRGVPIFPNGQLMFPDDSRLSANPQNLVTKRGSCPAPPAPGTPAFELQKTRDVCAPLSNGTLSRDCLLQQVNAAGCNDAGALAVALRTGNDFSDYTKNLRKTTPYSVYQQRSSVPLLETVLKDGSASKDVALSNFRSLAGQTTNPNGGLQAAARDLCLNAGALDQFDFCSELAVTTPPPYRLDCLQKAWLSRGGSRNGRKYPNEGTLASYWNGFKTWGLVIEDMDRIMREMKDTTYEAFTNPPVTAEQRQRAALMDGIGIEREAPQPIQIAPIPGVETFWFDTTNNTFLGRVSSSALPLIDTGGVIPDVNKSDQVQLVMITNMRPEKDMTFKMGVVTDDGTSITLNKNYKPTGQGAIVDGKNQLSRWYLQPPTMHVNNSCWEARKGGPNIIVADWYENYGYARFKLFMRSCTEGNIDESIPTNSLTLTQEQAAPFLSFDYKDERLSEFRLPALFECIKAGSAEADTTKGGMRLMRNGSLTIPKPISPGAWRTMTIRFVMNAVPQDRQVFCTYGSLFQITFESGVTKVRITGPTLNTTVEWNTGYVRGGEYIFLVNMRSSFEGSVPDIITFGVMPADWFAGGNYRGGIEKRTVNYQPLYNASDSHVFSMGSTTQVSADVSVKSIRFFDYEMNGADLARDVKNAWVRQNIIVS